MKKVLFLTLTLFLFTFGTVNLKGQVTIGSNSSPHPDAVLELKSNSRGLLLPQVSLLGVTDFLANGGDKESAKGMLVYNTGYALDPGLYIWTGAFWQSCNPGECPVPGKPASVSFSPGTATDIPVKTLISVTAGLAYGASSFEWTVPEEFEIVGNANAKTITIKAKQTGDFDASKVAVKAVNYCGEGDTVRGSGTIRIVTPASPPALPSFALPNTGTDLTPGDRFTITCGDVGADEYIWTLPAGVTPLTGAADTITDTHSITVTVAEGIYDAHNFKVKAKNGAGESAVRTAYGGRITAKSCSGEPNNAYMTAFQANNYMQNSTLTVHLMISTEGLVSYRWTLPAGLSAVSGDSISSIVIRCDRPGTYNGSDILCTVTNGCGTATAHSSGTFKVISTQGVKGTVTGTSGNTYTTYKYPNGLGTWMTQNSKEGSPAKTTYTGKDPGERGYYYTAGEASSGCPDGWTLPTPAQFADLWSYLSAKTSIDEQNGPWLDKETFAGGGHEYYWDEYVFYITSELGLRDYRIQVPATFSTNANINAAKSVRCVKDACDEAPAALSVGYLRPVAAPNGIDTIVTTYRSHGSTPTVSWNYPNGTTLLASSDTSIVLQYTTPGTFDWAGLSCTVTNDCGSATIAGSGTCTVASSLGTQGVDLEVLPNVYRTWNFPDGMGTWMVDFLREEPAYYTSGPGHNPDGSKGYYYTFSESLTACPAGWALPTRSEAEKAFNVWGSAPAGSPLRDFHENNYISYWTIDAGGYSFTTRSIYLRCDNGFVPMNNKSVSVVQPNNSTNQAMPISCIKR